MLGVSVSEGVCDAVAVGVSPVVTVCDEDADEDGDAVWLGDDFCVGVRDGVQDIVCDAVGTCDEEPVLVPLGDRVRDALGACVGVAVRLAVCEGVGDTLRLELCEGEAVIDDDCVGDAVMLVDGVAVAVEDTLGVDVGDFDPVGLVVVDGL